MKKFVPREKLGKRARRQLDSEQRVTWTFSPVTKKVESKKLYNRKRKSHDRYDYGVGFLFSAKQPHCLPRKGDEADMAELRCGVCAGYNEDGSPIL